MIESRKKHPYVKLGERIKEVRESLEQYKNIDNFSKATDIKKGNLYNYEQGKTLPPIDKFLILCKTLNKSPSYLLLPLLNLKQSDKELVTYWDKIKDLRYKPEEWEAVRTVMAMLDVYLLGLHEKREKKGEVQDVSKDNT